LFRRELQMNRPDLLRLKQVRRFLWRSRDNSAGKEQKGDDRLFLHRLNITPPPKVLRRPASGIFIVDT